MKIVKLDGIMTNAEATERARELGGHLPGNIPIFWPAGMRERLRRYCDLEGLGRFHLSKPGSYYDPSAGHPGGVERHIVDVDKYQLQAVAIIPDQGELL